MNILYAVIQKKFLCGQSLLELTVALGTLSILLTVASIAVLGAISNTQESQHHNLAGSYAQQGLEILRQMRDTNWTAFNSFSGAYCMASGCSQLKTSGSCGPRSGTDCGNNIASFYSREATLTPNSPQCSVGAIAATRVEVKVRWTDSKCAAGSPYCRNVSVETCFSNIYADTGL
jgi:type II secretory pathway pseudopilin PulG